MVASIVISIITCISLIICIILFPKIHIKKFEINTFWLVGVGGALLMIICSCVSFKEISEGLTANTKINPLKILSLFISMTILSIYLDEVGLFKVLANYTLKKAKASQISLFFIMYIVISILTIFTSNDIVILTFTPFICYFAKNAKINPLPYLVMEFAAANTWSMMLIIGNPTNVYLGSMGGYDFISYIEIMFLPTIFAGLTEILIIFLLFKNKLKEPLQNLPSEERINDKVGLIIGLVHLITCLVLLTISSYISIEMWLITVILAGSLILCISIANIIRRRKFSNLKQTFKRIPWNMIPFVISMFIIVLSLQSNGVTEQIGKMLGDTNIIWKYGFSSYISANLINNIPMSVLFSSISNTLTGTARTQAYFASIIGSNIGAFLTPIGALAGIMFTGILEKNDTKLSFVEFLKYGVIISIPTMAMALLGLFIIL